MTVRDGFCWLNRVLPLVALAPVCALAQAPDDEDEDPPPAVAAPVVVADAGVSDVPELTEEELRLVSGAPLRDPHVRVSVVERKEPGLAGRREVVLYPVALQLNGRFTQHYGTYGSFLWYVKERLAIHVTGGGNWVNVESSFNEELVQKVRREAQAASSLLWTWAVLGGVEVAPIYGKFAVFEQLLARFSLYISAGLGAGGTRHQLKPASVRPDGAASPATYGDTGVRFMGSVGMGVRLQLGESFAVRLEVKDVVYTARADQVNGCSLADLTAMDVFVKSSQDPLAAMTSEGCNKEAFSGTDGSGYARRNDVPLALNLVRVPSSDVLNNVGLYLGASFTF